MVVTVLMVAEKPSIAQTLADALSNNKYNSRSGVSPVCKVHEYEGDFYGQKAWFKVTSCAGHVYSIDFPPEFNNWDRVDPLTLFGAPTVRNESNPKLRMPKHFQTEAKGCQYLVLWLDCDREGENICYEVMDNVVPNLSSAGGQQQVWRAQFSSLAPQDLKKAMATLGSPNKDMSDSVDARAEMDLKLGCAFTRFQTKYFQGKYGDLDTNLVSYGPCQTPTLWFCVKRSDEINAFQPESYYTIDVQVTKAGKELPLTWDRGQVFDMPIATLFLNLLDDKAKAVVTDISQKEDRQARPQALNTVAMLKMASTRLGIGPDQAMRMAERLYLDGYLTYPRTETNTYPKNFDLQGAVRAQTGHPHWGDYSKGLLQQGLAKAREGTDMGDHPPITPVRAATEGQLGEAFRLYDMITRHFLATVSSDCKFLKTRVSFNIVGEGFSVSGRKVTDPGFTAIQRDGGMDDIHIPDFTKGEAVPLQKVSMGSHKTRPPSYLSESDLLTLMEKFGIGTDASMATHINNICERNYVTLEPSGRRLIPTKLGIALVHGYQMVDNELVIPKVRSSMEKNCTLVAEGKAEVLPVVQHCLRLFRDKFIYYVKHVDLVDQLFESIFQTLEAAGRPLSRCGVCTRYLSVVDRKPVRMFCKTCDRIFKMPQNGQMKLYKELKCPLDNFELVFVANKVGKSYPICPMCYDDPPFGDKEEQGKHWNLSHPIYKKYRPAVMSCIADNCPGTLCLDVDSAPKWQIDCNICLQQLSLFEDKAHKIKVSSDVCEECGSVLLDVTFNKGKSPLPDGATERKACLVCDEIFNALTVSKTGKGFFRRNPTAAKGKGKGKGKKGKGKGKAMSEDDKAEERGRMLAKQGKK